MDTITLMQFEAGELTTKEIVEMIGEMLAIGCLDNYEPKFRKLANKYISKGYLDEEGNVNYIKLKEED